MLIDLIDAVLHHGLSWLTVIAIVNLYFKDRRRKKEHKKIDHIIELLEGMGCAHSSKSITPIAGRRKTRFTLLRPGNITAPIVGRFTHYLMRRKNMNKWLNPSLLTVVVTLIATYLNQQFGWKLDPVQIVGILLVIGHYAVTQEIVHAKQKANGTFSGYTLNSSKLVIAILGSLAIGFCTVVGIPATPADIFAVVTVIVGFVTGRGYHDVKQGGSNAQYTDTTGPTK